jgi:hypothetical protein
MFPASTGGDPPTPRNNATFSGYQGHTLSPPNSQNTNLYAAEQATSYETMDMDVAGGGISQILGGEDELTGDGGMDEKKEPGWSWKNGKAREEYSRAMELVADKGFNLSELLLIRRSGVEANIWLRGVWGSVR